MNPTDWREHTHDLSDILNKQHGPNLHTHGTDGKVDTIMGEPYPSPCHCNTERRNPNCHIDHTLSAIEVDLAFGEGRGGRP